MPSVLWLARQIRLLYSIIFRMVPAESAPNLELATSQQARDVVSALARLTIFIDPTEAQSIKAGSFTTILHTPLPSSVTDRFIEPPLDDTTYDPDVAWLDLHLVDLRTPNMESSAAIRLVRMYSTSGAV